MNLINYFGCAMQVTSYSSTNSEKNFNVENRLKFVVVLPERLTSAQLGVMFVWRR